MDVTRLLVESPDVLNHTDIAEHAREQDPRGGRSGAT
jgi:hypothetical protein